jgi:hypothetical protein
MDLLVETLPDIGEYVAAELEQVERIYRNSGAWQLHPQGLADGS